ncbi:Scr1 family TA system antitoxin-like transcriptional regulator [Streptomyces lydicus]|uniref:Scr1 family TA system antitoxin-like transcriptional regulator n=1 Tax=Streptomyces lydicus TaxID=47763 RepID=UPI003D6829AF
MLALAHSGTPPLEEAPPAHLVVGSQLRYLHHTRGGMSGEGHDRGPRTLRAPQRDRGYAAALQPDRVAAVLGRFGLDQAEVAGALNLLDRPECRPVRDNGVGWAARLAACENSASHLRIYALQILPQLLQTPAFTRALQSVGVLPQGYHPERTLAASSAVRIELTADWAFLERANGGPRVMAEQLSHLLQRIDAGQAARRPGRAAPASRAGQCRPTGQAPSDHRPDRCVRAAQQPGGRAGTFRRVQRVQCPEG